MEQLAQWVWGTPTLILLLVVGIVLSVGTGFVQIRRFGAAIRQVAGSLSGGDRSSFRAVCTALAGTVGTGNVAGVAGAIALGGPGAVFWMWVSAFLGMATKYCEVVLAVCYRRPGPEGTWLGGPMYYIRDGLGPRWRGVAAFFALSTVLASFAMGNMAQVHTMVSTVRETMPRCRPEIVALVVGVSAAVIVGLVTVAGAVSIGRWMEKLIPVVALIYVLGAVVVLVCHWRRLPGVLWDILRGAFQPWAVVGGAAGIGIRQALRWGVARGVFSNEAGLGSAPIAHASARTDPERQGLMGIFEVFLDTIVLCTLTALVILVSGVPVPYGQAAGAELVVSALETVYGPHSAAAAAACLGLLALATLISWQLYGQRCAAYLWGARGAAVYRLAYLGIVVLGATMDLSAVWAISDVCNGLMCLPNLLALLLLRKQAGQAPWKTV